MIRLLLFDLRRRFAPAERRLRSACLREVARIPPALRPDMGLSEARMADLAEAHVRSVLAARREAEARELLAALDRMARARGFPGLCWSPEAEG